MIRREKLKVKKCFLFKKRNKLKKLARNRCNITGRGRGYYRLFGLSRHALRDMAHYGLLPGVTKASW